MNQTLQKLGWNWAQYAVSPTHILLPLPPPPSPAWLGFHLLAHRHQLAMNWAGQIGLRPLGLWMFADDVGAQDRLSLRIGTAKLL